MLIVANGCHDLTVPYPSAAIASFDPFMDYEHTGVNVDTEEDDAHVVRGWSVGVNAQALETKVGELAKRQKVTKRAKLPPFLQFRWPYNYVSPTTQGSSLVADTLFTSSSMPSCQSSLRYGLAFSPF